MKGKLGIPGVDTKDANGYEPGQFRKTGGIGTPQRGKRLRPGWLTKEPMVPD